MDREAQECPEVACVRPAAFSTCTNPAWCDEHITAILDEHITAILRAGGLEPVELFEGPGTQTGVKQALF